MNTVLGFMPDADPTMAGLLTEARQKLKKVRPVNLGQASRIPGVNPADIAVLSVWLKKQRGSGEQSG